MFDLFFCELALRDASSTGAGSFGASVMVEEGGVGFNELLLSWTLMGNVKGTKMLSVGQGRRLGVIGAGDETMLG